MGFFNDIKDALDRYWASQEQPQEEQATPKMDTDGRVDKEMPTRDKNVDVSDQYGEPAYNGSLEVTPINMVPYATYNDFLDNKDNFLRMTFTWAMEDDPMKRQDILKEGDNNYGFNNNILFSELMNTMVNYDKSDDDAIKKNEKRGLFTPWSILERISIGNKLKSSTDSRTNVQNPYYKA